MSTMRDSWIKRFLALVAAATLVAGLAGCGLEELLSARSEATRTESASFAVAGLPVLEIVSSNGGVNVRGVPGQADVQVTATIRSRGKSQEQAKERAAAVVLRLEQQGGRILVAYRGSEQTDEIRRTTGVSFDVTTPPMITLDVQTSNGAVAAASLQGRLELGTSNGAVTLADVVGQASAHTSNGRISAERCQGVLELETSNGEIRMVDVSAAFDASTSNGAAVFAGIPVGDANSLSTSNGRIAVSVPATAAIEFSASTSSGSISSALPLEGDTEGKEWKAALNPPPSAKLALRTSNGAIHIGPLP